MATLIKQYLNEPEGYYRRFRIKTGNDEYGNNIYDRQWKKRVQQPDGSFRWVNANPKDYPSGQGVYRSSYMNARRLAATETNIAYRTADHERVQRFDFVVGIEVHLSNNHNCKGVPNGEFVDICDQLQGRYPKDFKFVGWHPHCRCFTTTIHKTPEEFEADQQRILQGEEPSAESVNTVKDVPQGFKDWVEDNEERIARTKSLPYFLRDNGKVVNGGWVGNTNRKTNDLPSKIAKALAPTEHSLYISFEPFSPAIVEAVKAAHDRKAKNKILAEILNDERATLLNETQGYTTRLFAGHRGTNKPTWNATKQMGFDLNNGKISVVFLPELKGKTSADALIYYIDKKYLLADFKYAITTNGNTLSKEIEKGFLQASTIVLKLENMDAGQFKEAIEYIKRNNIRYGNIILINQFGKYKNISFKDIAKGRYVKKIKGFL